MIDLYKLIASVAIVLFAQNCFGQIMGSSSNESFTNLTVEVIRNEIASFKLKSSLIIETDNLSKVKLEEILLKKCSETFAHFEKGNIYDSEIIVDIESETSNSITAIRLLYGRYGQYFLPDSAIAGIYNPKFCEKYTKRGRPKISSCKVFRSEDKRRIYIYILSGEGAERYEVTWVVQDGQYYTRAIDPV